MVSGTVGRGGGGGARGILGGQELVLRGGRDGGLQGDGVRQDDGAIGRIAGQGPGHVQPEGGEQAQLVHTQVGVGGVVVQTVGAQILLATQHGQALDRGQLDQHAQQEKGGLGSQPSAAAEQIAALAAEEQQEQRNGHEQQG